MPDGTATAVVNKQPTLSEMAERFIKLRDRVREIKEQQKLQLEPYNQALADIEGALMGALDQAGLSAVRGNWGTVYKSTQTSVTVSDWPVTLDYIRQTERWDLLEARVNKTQAVALTHETGTPPPGVSVTRALALHVRKG